MKRITLREGEAIEVEAGARVELLRIEGNGRALVGVTTTAAVKIDSERKPRKPLIKRSSPTTR